MAVTGLILAGGRATRMGGSDKGLQLFRGMPLVQHVMGRLNPQVDAMIINANRHLEQYATLGVPVITDEIADFAGPLAGLQAGLRHCQTPLMLTASCDSPFLPEDLGKRLLDALQRENADIAAATTGTQEAMQLHPVFCLLKTELLPKLTTYLESGGRKMREWQNLQKLIYVRFPDERAFYNLNTLDELRSLE